jgi:hypothetical protein
MTILLPKICVIYVVPNPMRYIPLIVLMALFVFPTWAQSGPSATNFAEGTLAVGSSQGSLALSYFHDWKLGKSKKFGIGLGGRFTSYFGQNKYYTTAPARLTSGTTGPSAIFQDDIVANIDSLLVSSPQVNALNLFLNLDYPLTSKLWVGFNIDVIGFSFGGTRQTNYINGATGKITDASPTAFNLLLVSDNDLGSLNSEFYLKYFLNEKWALKAGGQFLFTEYTTATQVQTYPEGNDRFRNKALMFSFGVSYILK